MKKIAIIGGGAAGLACAVMLARKGCSVTLLERGERVGRKLASTGNGQGNLTNTDMNATHYFSDDLEKTGRLLSRFGYRETISFLESMGGIFLPDGRGRVYPAGRQASAVVDLFRFELERHKCGKSNTTTVSLSNGRAGICARTQSCLRRAGKPRPSF